MRRCVLGLALGAWIASGLACGVGQSPTVPPVLTDVRAVPAQGRFLVTPRWSPTGDRLLLSGWRGVGLTTLDTATGAMQDLDWHARTRARWDAIGKIAPDTAPVEGDSEVIFDRDGIRVLDRIRDGMLEAITPHGTTQIAAGGTWAARVSPDGRLVAYCTGHLPSGRLRIVEIGGPLMYEGPGVHAAWLPNEPGLVYAVPEERMSDHGTAELGGSDLYMISAPAWTPVRLTTTPDVYEMEPAVSPAGDRLAFSDWKTGTLSIARLADKAGAR
jgi:hypothetical protein